MKNIPYADLPGMKDITYDDLPGMISNKNDTLSNLRSLRSSNPKNVVLSYINVNSIRNKLNDLKNVVFNNVDLVCIAETKLDESFPESQFVCAGFKKPYRFDVTDKSGGLLLYVNESIPSRILPHNLPPDIQCIPIELNLRKQKWLVFNIYRPPSQSIKYFVEKISDQLDIFSTNYDNVILLGDFNDTPLDTEISSFMANYNLYSLINIPTCFKSASGRCIDLIY